MHRSKQLTSFADEANGNRILELVEKCLRQGCVIRLEHTPVMAPRFTPWQDCVQSCCYSGDPQQIIKAIECCFENFSDHHIRLVMEDFSSHSRFTFVLNNPVVAEAA